MTNLLVNLNVWGKKKFAQKMFIFAQFLEKFAKNKTCPNFGEIYPISQYMQSASG